MDFDDFDEEVTEYDSMKNKHGKIKEPRKKKKVNHRENYVDPQDID